MGVKKLSNYTNKYLNKKIRDLKGLLFFTLILVRYHRSLFLLLYPEMPPS